MFQNGSYISSCVFVGCSNLSQCAIKKINKVLHFGWLAAVVVVVELGTGVDGFAAFD